MRKPTINKGDKYGMLTAVKFHHKNKWNCQHWLFKCECGNEKVLNTNNVKNGNTTSCGCVALRGNNLKHGMNKTKTHYCWYGMRSRCFDKNRIDYKYWGGRGITICSRWLGKNGFENFLSDMGEKPEGLSLDRIDNDGNYCPENCRYATSKQQNNNKRNVFLCQ